MKFPLLSDATDIDPALAGRKVFVLIWTMAPWTLSANLGIAVHPTLEYSAVEHNDEVYIAASALVENVFAKCGLSVKDNEGKLVAPLVLFTPIQMNNKFFRRAHSGDSRREITKPINR